MPPRGRSLSIVIGMVLISLMAVPVSMARSPHPQGTPAPEVYAEAQGSANLRTGPGVDYPLAGEIVAGTPYRVLARHSLVPWLKLDYPPNGAWVFKDLVTITGTLALVPTISNFDSIDIPTATPAPVITLGGTPDPALPPAASPTPASTIAATPTINGPTATTLGEANIRFGPGVEYPAIIKVQAGMTYRILERHTTLPWVRIALPESPTGNGWIFNDVIEIAGDMSIIPATSLTQFSYPTLTPTPDTVVVNGAPWTGAQSAPGALANTLGQPVHAYLLDQGFAPYTDHLASVFVMDLTSGDTFTVNDGVAFSGMSLTKIPILAAYFQRHVGPLSKEEAFLVADTMMCSENITTNKLLEIIGDGDALQGAQYVTAFLQSLGLTGTFIMRQYVTNPDEPPVGVGTVRSGADQTSARPDAYNQTVPKELGWLLAGIYQCAQDGTGLLVERYPGDFDTQECRQMLYAMDSNTIGVFLEAGVPGGTRVIHKHGWVDDTHGDAGIVIGPSGAYVFVAALYGRDWLEFDRSSQIIGELSRMTWNTFNPGFALATTTAGIVPATCDPNSDPVMSALLSINLPMVGE
ncbi:MAG: serine hydrolase [Chloroflexi bacterium]|nr:serine hydrolase [Chloroflexota bacterium]